MGYDLTKSAGLNFSKGRWTLLRPFVWKSKAPDYYHKTRRGMGYVSTQSRKILNLQNGSVMTTHQEHRCGGQCQRWCHLQRSFNKYGFNRSSIKWR